MTNLDKLKEIILTDNKEELYKWLIKFGYYIDPGAWIDIDICNEFLNSAETQSNE